MLRRKFCDPKFAPLDRMWSVEDTYLDLAASAADATEHFRDQKDHEVEKLLWPQFHNPERPLAVDDRLAQWAELNRLSGLAMKYVMGHLWPGRPKLKSYFSLVQQFLDAVPRINAMKRSALGLLLPVLRHTGQRWRPPLLRPEIRTKAEYLPRTIFRKSLKVLG